jgi:hypothetical protein
MMGAMPRAQVGTVERTNRKILDELLDQYVRDGFVYYRALKSERGKLDAFVNQLSATDPSKLAQADQIAFWLNAYNALVLRTIVDHYPIQGRAPDYPAHSVRQVPGAFERQPHRIGGRTLTLDEIERNVLPEFHDPRVYFALGRGAIGSGRLRSEAYSPDRLEVQLAEVAAECASRPECVQVDRQNNKVLANPIFSWREKEFVAAYADSAASPFAGRSSIERAILAFVSPKLLSIERDFLARDGFQVAFQRFDWSLNDLTGRGGR